MLIRKYKGKNLKDALAQVKSDLGDEATIISTRTIRAGLLRSQLEVTATLPPVESSGFPPQRAARPDPKPAAPDVPSISLEVQHVARFLSPLRQEIRALHSDLKVLADHSSYSSDNTLDELRDLLKALQQTEPEDSSPNPEVFDQLEQKLQASGIRVALINRILQSVGEQLPTDPTEAEACSNALATKVIQDDLSCISPLENTALPRVVALVGPAGVGKTTTIAKIAARAALIHNQKVALIGCDTERIGALRSLEETANLIGIPFGQAHNAEELERAVAALAGNDLILIDTSGHSHREIEALSELHSTLARVQAEPILLLNVDMRVLEIDPVLESYSQLAPKSLILTKIDQAVGLGGLYDIAFSSHLPVMYLTNGRQIPEDIEAASSGRMASLIMGLQYN